jgi:hypothetical protein
MDSSGFLNAIGQHIPTYSKLAERKAHPRMDRNGCLLLKHMSVRINLINPADWREVCSIYEEGIATGLGTPL